MRCPSCREPLDERELHCPSGHEFETVDGAHRMRHSRLGSLLDRRRGRPGSGVWPG